LNFAGQALALIARITSCGKLLRKLNLKPVHMLGH